MTNPLPAAKLATQSVSIHYSDGEEIVIKPVPWKLLGDLRVLLEIIAKEIVDKDGYIGEILDPSNKPFWDNAKKIAALMPVVGSDELGIDLDRIEEVDDLIQLFITANPERHLTTGGVYSSGNEGWIPGSIARINSINFQKLLMNQVNPMSQKRSSTKSSK